MLKLSLYSTPLNGTTKFQIPRLRACAGPLVTQQACAADVREDTEGPAKQIGELDVLVDDQRTEWARRELRRVDIFRDSFVRLSSSISSVETCN
ncbi:uncharacterized protein BJ212DRAFT_1324610 [Suillus subaureus]|uniref:Uncharacterized protein n=1 Tax=Suillus subaureus TaxID=48587 RepID=A0A9P7EJ52_9AGAM|nr:uncharacterized protein BJ212DRAFT_1324610 [Suillus subaureus]KAG1823494.1 hypothetical protein BJ212DRAFT_1324610 [Suillus subaureus]